MRRKLEEQLKGIEIPFADVQSWFDRYTAATIERNPAGREGLILKREHTFRVLEETELLVWQLHAAGQHKIVERRGIGEQRLDIARTIAILHDAGRFLQFERYGSFADFETCNHAAMSVRIAHRELRTMFRDVKDVFQRLILRPIAFHNRLVVPKGEDSDVIFYTNIIRDADKIDILRVMNDISSSESQELRNTVLLGLGQDGDISDAVFTRVMDGKPVDYSIMKNHSDFRALLLGWAFDIHFDEALQRILDIGLFQMILGSIPHTEKRDRLEQRVFGYIGGRLGEI